MRTELTLSPGRVHLSSITFTSSDPIYLFYLIKASSQSQPYLQNLLTHQAEKIHMTVLLVESNLKSFKYCANIDPYISLFIRFKNSYCKVYFVVRSSLEKWNFLKISSLDGLLRRTKTVRFSYDKICCVQIANGGACDIQVLSRIEFPLQ